MSNKVPLVIADFETSLASAVSAGATSFTLASATDDDGNSLAAGKYCFTINNGSSNKQYLLGQLNGTAVTSVVYVDRRGNETSGAQYAARAGAPVIISDFATIQRVADILRGQETLDGDNPIYYDAEPTLAARAEIATVGYVLDQVNGGTVDFDNQIISSSDATAGETISAGDWVFFNTADQEWYQIDADTAAEVDAAYIGVALGAGTDGASITGGIQISGVYTTTGLTAGDIYYLSNTAGAITNSAGTTERAIGVALSTTKLLMNFQEKRLPTANEKDALAGAGAAPSSSNKYLTEGDIDDNTIFIPPTVEVFTTSGTWTKDAGLKYVVVEVVGGGGGGGFADAGEAGSGGGGGGYARKLIAASSLGATETVTVGAAGSGGVDTGPTNATAGGNSSFGAHCTANGGAAGPNNTSTGGAGGSATGGDINISGGGGGSGATTDVVSGQGGNSVLGHTGAGKINIDEAGSPGTGYGAGGSGGVDAGGATTGTNGGAGTAGIVIVTEYYS